MIARSREGQQDEAAENKLHPNARYVPSGTLSFKEEFYGVILEPTGEPDDDGILSVSILFPSGKRGTGQVHNSVFTDLPSAAPSRYVPLTGDITDFNIGEQSRGAALSNPSNIGNLELMRVDVTMHDGRVGTGQIHRDAFYKLPLDKRAPKPTGRSAKRIAQLVQRLSRDETKARAQEILAAVSGASDEVTRTSSPFRMSTSPEEALELAIAADIMTATRRIGGNNPNTVEGSVWKSSLVLPARQSDSTPEALQYLTHRYILAVRRAVSKFFE